MNLELYVLDEEYVSYLHDIESKVMFWDSEQYKHSRKYVGVVFTINGFSYFAPLSSPKPSDYFYREGERHIKKDIIPLIRLVDDDGILLGKIKLNNMIPVRETNIHVCDIEHEPDRKYRNFLLKDMICIRKAESKIKKYAQILYKQKTRGYKNIPYLDNTVDFVRLEAACLAYERPESRK